MLEVVKWLLIAICMTPLVFLALTTIVMYTNMYHLNSRNRILQWGMRRVCRFFFDSECDIMYPRCYKCKHRKYEKTLFD